jgi:Type II secretion system (T2SS), protein G
MNSIRPARSTTGAKRGEGKGCRFARRQIERHRRWLPAQPFASEMHFNFRIALFLFIGVVGVKGGHGAARMTAVKSELQTLKSALDSFHMDTGFYPAGTNGLATS